ncbi:aminoglycoside phosphotransferase family protein [Kiloniella laminariae]|uniref:aminoglycoside phosphotransferase family protein n=1 Tax=Kiloniella laminariae TaxID=454162 RepID=UPI00035F2683|nr:phosphotransferase [Kiloniella laminariae]
MIQKSEEREKQRIAFVSAVGWAGARITALPVDASARSYYRLSRTSGPEQGAKTEPETRILMDAPPGIAEPVEVFAQVARHLMACGISTPVIYNEDIAQGFLLLEDFGDQTYARLLQTGVDETGLYELAVDVLAAMHSAPEITGITMPPYDLDFLIKEALIMADWYLPAVMGKGLSAEARQAYVNAWKEVIEKPAALPDTLVLRDFHVDNLMILEGRSGVKACGLLDFQTARIGAPPYDLMSLVEDARRDIGTDLREQMIARYFTLMNRDYSSEESRQNFMCWYRILAAQRHAKVAGLFSRLYARDAKAGYLKHLPRVLRLLTEALSDEALEPVRRWLSQYCPDYQREYGRPDSQMIVKAAVQTEKLGLMLE